MNARQYQEHQDAQKWEARERDEACAEELVVAQNDDDSRWEVLANDEEMASFVTRNEAYAYAERIARVPEADVYRVPGYVACLERWTGPVA